MSKLRLARVCAWGLLGVLGMVLAGSAPGCGGSGAAYQFAGSPFAPATGTNTGTTGPTTSGRVSGSDVTGTGTSIDPCDEPQDRKYVRIAMRNQSRDYIHYFLVLIAFVNSDEYPLGGVCPDDIALYTAFGYVQIRAGDEIEFGNFCIQGPALYYFHRNGQFRAAGAGALSSAIAPASGSTPSYDAFFTSAGARIPVPDIILFHNPGTTTEGRNLKFSRNDPAPCSEAAQILGDPPCEQDSWYYVRDDDTRAGTAPVRGSINRAGVYVRVPSEIQGTGCQCGLSNDPSSILALPGTRATAAACNEFFRGGRIDYVFLRDDRDPAYPQLVWRVTDANGSVAHAYDPAANIP